MDKPAVKAKSYFLIALIIFSFLGLEFLVFFLSRLVDGRSMGQLFSWPIHWYGAVFHWTVTILIWAAGAIGIYRWLKKRGGFDAAVRVNRNKGDGLLLVLGIVVLIVYELVLSRLTGSQILQIWREFQGFQRMYGEQAWVVSKFQNLYYVVEFALVVMMIAFFQRAGELGFKANWFPWGGLGLSFTWGAIHLVTNPQGAVRVILWAVLLGIYFLVTKKSFWLVWLVGFLGFIL
jgi:hypothetical protein